MLSPQVLHLMQKKSLPFEKTFINQITKYYEKKITSEEVIFCDPAGIRTQDPYIKSVLLYQLSYRVFLIKNQELIIKKNLFTDHYKNFHS